jgi:hypothetical protein
VRCRVATTNAFEHSVNGTIAALNDLALSPSSSVSSAVSSLVDNSYKHDYKPDSLDSVSSVGYEHVDKISSLQSRITDRIRSSVADYQRAVRQHTDTVACAAPFSAISGPQSSIGSSEHTPSLFDDSFSFDTSVVMNDISLGIDSYFTQGSPAVPIVADKVALPDKAGTIDLISVLPDSMKQLYSSPLNLLDVSPRSAPSPRLYASQPEWHKLVIRMMKAQMIRFVSHPIIVNGVFAIDKDAFSQRLIFHGAPVNGIFVPPQAVQLPTPEVFTKMQLANKDHKLFLAKSDARNFFFCFRVPDSYAPFFAMPPVVARAVGLEHVFGDVLIYPCLTVVPMGWSHAVLVTQSAHLQIITKRTSLRTSDALFVHDNDFVIDRPRFALCIDDLILVSYVKRRVARLLWEYKRAMSAYGVEFAAAKMRAASDADLEGLGVVISPKNRRVGVAAHKLARLCRDTRLLVAAGKASGLVVASLVGRWTWAALVSRPFLANFSAVYRFILVADKRVYFLWSSVARELLRAVALAPLLWAPLSPTWASVALASDASETGMGVCMAESAGPDVALTLGAPDALRPPADMRASVPPVRKYNWRVVVSARWKWTEHINLLEMRAAYTAVRRFLSSSFSDFFLRLRLFVDSSVVCGALIKGRASSFDLLSRLRPLSALLLATGTVLLPWWVPSADNPADAASRAFSC